MAARKKKSGSRRPAAKKKAAKTAKSRVVAKKKAAKAPKRRVAAKKPVRAAKKRVAAKKRAAAKKPVAAPRPAMVPPAPTPPPVPAAAPAAVTELDNRIAIVRANLRDLVDQAASSAGAANEELLSQRIAEQEERLRRLRQERDQISEEPD
jgi:hypothetical protein